MTTPLALLQQFRQDLTARFPERREVIDGSLYALLAGEHVLLLGPPGTAKSALVRVIAQAFGGTYFERLLTKFSPPEELFGPISLKALEQDRYARVTTDQLPEAHFAIVDEFFKANSSILNTLLSLMNERLFHNDGAAQPCPLITLFGASNELPEGKELEAVFDRFLLRYSVDYLMRSSNFRSVILAPDPAPTVSLSLDVLREAQRAAAAVTITDRTVDALVGIRDSCRANGIIASDRRWKRTLKAVQASAYLAGETSTCPEDLLLLTDALWREPKERSKIARLVGQLADPISAKASEIVDAARETAARIAGLRATDRKAYVAQAAQALEDFRAQQTLLTDLVTQAGPRAKQAITDASSEIAQLHSDLARVLTTGLGLGGAR